MPSREDKKALRAREDLFESLAKSSMIGIYLVQDGRFVFGNPLFERCTGYRIDELLGVDCLALVISEDKPVVRENAGKMLKGEPVSPYEYRFRAKSGELKWVLEMVTPVQYRGKRAALVNFVDITERKWVEEELRQYRLHLEELVEERSAELRQANSVLHQEIAERRRAEETLRKSEERYRTLFEESRDAIFLTSREGIIVEVNQAALELFGYTRVEMIGLDARKAYANPDDRLRFQAEIERQGAVRDYELQLCRKDGTVIDCLMSATVWRGPDGRVLGYQGIIRDITERKRAEQVLADYSRLLEQQVARRTQALLAKNAQLEETLRQLQEMQQQVITQQKLASLGALTAGIAHEIRNPLNFVTNFADLSTELIQELRDIVVKHTGLFDTDAWTDLEEILFSLDQNVQKITEHGKRADRIVTGMLQHSRGQPGAYEPTDLNALLAEYVNLAHHSMRAQDTAFNITIETVYDPSLGLAEVVPQDIGQVFLNVISNACYAVHTKYKGLGEGFRPVLAVRTRNLGDTVEIRIRDNGDGIPPTIRDQIFQPFFTTKPAGAGTGLGLSISYDIVVQEHKGQITVDTAIGEFTEFVISLPKRAP
jgi:PAS domain S-box-containing protein